MINLFIAVSVIVVIGILYICFVPSANSPLTNLWENLPTKDLYIKAHPSDVTADGKIRCYHCHSTEILDVGLARFADFRRTILCQKCKAQLWREEG